MCDNMEAYLKLEAEEDYYESDDYDYDYDYNDDVDETGFDPFVGDYTYDC